VRGLGKDTGNLDKNGNVKYPVRLPTEADVNRCLATPVFDRAPWDMFVSPDESFRNCLEGFSGDKNDPSQNMHNIVHDWVGGMFLVGDRIRYGTMEPLETSPNDPIFFIHHASVDRLWAQWEESHPDAYRPQGEGQVGWNPEDTMYPFDQYRSDERMKAHGLTIKSMLGTKDLNYEYK
jgi:tyrosinase